MSAGPEISVVFATHNRARRLALLLESLRRQTIRRDAFEIIVVDDASQDETPAVLAVARDRGDLDLRTIRRPRAEGPAAARNDGWRAARAPLVAFTDDDCTVAPDWLDAGMAALRAAPGSFVQGRTDPSPGEAHLAGPFTRTLQIRSLGPYFQTCNVFYPRELLERLGGFDESVFWGGEDADLAWRAISQGVRPAFAEDAQVFHGVRRVGPVGKLRVAWRWTETMRLFAHHPELRREALTHRIFWKGSHYLLARALLAMVLPRRLGLLRAWLARPYVLHLLERGRIEGGGPLLAPYYLLHDLVELTAALRGAVRYRTLVI